MPEMRTNQGPAKGSNADSSAGQWLMIDEMAHRVMNQYASAISSLSLAIARTESQEVKVTLQQVAHRLRNFADLHRALQIPPFGYSAELSVYLGEVCSALVGAGLSERGVQLTLVEQPVLLEADRCWRVGLIIAELVTNATRHAFRHAGGRIVVNVRTAAGEVQCWVTDDGQPPANPRPGRGSRIVEALANELGGSIARSFSDHGTTVLLSFPQDRVLHSTDPGRHSR